MRWFVLLLLLMLFGCGSRYELEFDCPESVELGEYFEVTAKVRKTGEMLRIHRGYLVFDYPENNQLIYYAELREDKWVSAGKRFKARTEGEQEAKVGLVFDKKNAVIEETCLIEVLP